jgi:hypothetical protein
MTWDAKTLRPTTATRRSHIGLAMLKRGLIRGGVLPEIVIRNAAHKEDSANIREAISMATNAPRSTSKSARRPSPPQQPFEKRFAVNVHLFEATRRFVNRITNQVFGSFFAQDIDEETFRGVVLWRIADDLGDKYNWDANIDRYVRDDYVRCLQVLESSYAALESKKHRKELSRLILYALSVSEIDLGIEWRDGIFIRKGAVLLDEVLVNQNLAWLAQPELSNVHAPFEKALSHYLRMQRDAKLGADVITDMYEALEALAKIVTGRPEHDLSSNAELFLSKVKASEGYKPVLRSYIKFANDFRHGLASRKSRTTLLSREVESFIYLTGLFIRLATPE